MSLDENGGDETQVSTYRLQPQTLISPRSITALILRMRALISTWIAVEVDDDSITGTEGIVTEGVIKTFLIAGGDLGDAVPFALLESKKSFLQ